MALRECAPLHRKMAYVRDLQEHGRSNTISLKIITKVDILEEAVAYVTAFSLPKIKKKGGFLL
jgi:hypothetical protein